MNYSLHLVERTLDLALENPCPNPKFAAYFPCDHEYNHLTSQFHLSSIIYKTRIILLLFVFHKIIVKIKNH